MVETDKHWIVRLQYSIALSIFSLWFSFIFFLDFCIVSFWQRSYFLLFFLRAVHLWHTEVPRLGVQSELQLLTYTTAHGNDGSLTHWAGPGIKPTSSWIPVGFISPEPQGKFPENGHSYLRLTLVLFLCL